MKGTMTAATRMAVLVYFLGIPGFISQAMTNDTAVTQQAITLDGSTLAYTATAGFIPLTDPGSSREVARIFYVAYVRDGLKDPEERPLTFAFNGGPGAASMFLHLGALGPKTIPRSPDGTELLPPPYSLEDNPNTLLDLTDLVFIDPVGTGFSEPVGGTDPRKFWGCTEDLDSLGAFIREYLTREGRWRSPLFIAAESYGGFRAAGLARNLQDKGAYVMGLVMISPAIDFSTIQWSSPGDEAKILSLPSYAATAWYHKKITPRLRKDLDAALSEVRAWSVSHLLPAYWAGQTLSKEEKKALAGQMAEYIGVSPEWILANNLRVREREFAGEILRAEGHSVSVYDSRVTAWGPYTGDDNDLGMFDLAGLLKTTINDYIRKDLAFTGGGEYRSGNAQVYLEWNWETGRPAPVNADSISTGYPDARPWLEQALKRAAFLKVFIASGLFDLEVPYDSVLYTINQLDIPDERRSHIALHTYLGGHMFYANPDAHRELKKDLEKFYKSVLDQRQKGASQEARGSHR